MPLRIRYCGNVCILDIEGTIDINSSDIIEAIGWLVNSGKLNIIANLANVESVDYSGLSVLAIAYKKVINNNGKLKFLKVSLPVLELIRLVRLDSVFEIHEDEQAAIMSFIEEVPADKMHLRRKFARLDIHLRVKFAAVGGPKKGVAFEGEALNISAAGLFLRVHDLLPLHSKVELEFTIPESERTLKTGATVVWLADKELQPHSFPGMGVAFSQLDPEAERLILDFVDKNIIHRAEPE